MSAIDQISCRVKILEPVRAGSIGKLAMTTRDQIGTRGGGIQHRCQKPQGASGTLEPTASTDALEDQIHETGQKGEGILEPIQIFIRCLDAQTIPGIYVRPDE